MSATVATATEVAQARSFLKYLGKNWRDEYLLLAVIAFFRGARITNGLAAAKKLKAGKEKDGYGMVIRTLNVGGLAGAGQFLYALAISNWDAKHFGLDPADENSVNRLTVIFNAFKSYVTPETQREINEAKRQEKIAKAKAKAFRPPVNPKALQAPVYQRNWVSGFAVRRMYDQSHKDRTGTSTGLVEYEA